MEEYLNIYDEENNSLNQVKSRKEVHELGLWHREIQVWIINERNEVLIQKRAATKKLGANQWSVCAGHIQADEMIIEAAMREAEEEVGLKNINPADLILYDVKKCESPEDQVVKNNHYKYCYIIKTNTKIEDFKIQEEELSEIKYVSINKLKKMPKKELENFTQSLRNIESYEQVEKKLKELEGI